ncbi:DUF6634 family protein [Bosea sp. ASV33]|uniref:DUF6634 family protein n=1 Tax=Bosea sp. ASV33 TaxID=2795106 RepID=UPI0018EB53BE|nr:DUF6634 family protein [Bosea sp. ASV33]
MIYPHPDLRPVPELAPEIEKLRHLVRDLDRIRMGKHPGVRELGGAPTITDWSPAERREVALVGRVHGHPTIEDGRQAGTSILFFLAPELGYARTLSRFYKLGDRFQLSDRWDFR